MRIRYVQWCISWANATRRANSIDAARLIFVNAAERHPAAAVIQYNLACYSCQLGDLEEAKARLKLAFELDAKLRLDAMDDVDLEPLWGSLGSRRRQATHAPILLLCFSPEVRRGAPQL